jgi:hypothetical protein
VTSILDRHAGASGGAGDVLPMAQAAGAIAAFQAAAASLVVVLVPVVLTWVVTGGGAASWLDVVRLAAAFWLLAQHTGLAVDGGHLALVPLGMAPVPLLACAYAGARLARSLDPLAERIAAGSSRATPAPAPRNALITMAITHGMLGVLAGALAVTDLARPVLWQAFAGPAVVGLAGSWLGSLGYVHGGPREAVAVALDALPSWAHRYRGPVAATLAAQLGAAALALLVAIGFGAARVAGLYQALGGGLLGVLMITLLQLLLLPNVVVWAAAALAGPGFSIGTGTGVSPLTSTLGPLPALPLLGALPDPGPMPGYALAVLVAPVIAGAVGGSRLLRLPPVPGRFGAVRDVVVLAALAGGLFGVLSWLSGGPAGPGRLADTGPAPHLAAAAFAVEVALGAALVLLVRRGAPALADALAARRDGYRRGS